MIYKAFYVFFSDFLNHQQPNPTLNPSIPTPIQPNCSRGQANKSPVSINLAFARALASTWKTVVGGLGPNDLYFWRQNLQKKAQSPIKTRVIYLYRDIYNIYIYFLNVYICICRITKKTQQGVCRCFFGGVVVWWLLIWLLALVFCVEGGWGVGALIHFWLRLVDTFIYIYILVETQNYPYTYSYTCLHIHMYIHIQINSHIHDIHIPKFQQFGIHWEREDIYCIW